MNKNKNNIFNNDDNNIYLYKVKSDN